MWTLLRNRISRYFLLSAVVCLTAAFSATLSAFPGQPERSAEKKSTTSPIPTQNEPASGRLLGSRGSGQIDEAGSSTERVPSGDKRSTEERPKLILLKSGQVVQGEVRKTETGYEVLMAAGKYVAPKEIVRAVATDLHDAYKQLDAEITVADPRKHLELARWCFQHGLGKEAEEQVRLVMALAPDNSNTQVLINQIERGELSTNEPRRLKLDNAASPLIKASKSKTGMGGLPAELSARFSTRVQPMLLKSCATTGCHTSATDRAFHLAIPRGSSRPETTLANLQQALRQIDRDVPVQSPLFRMAKKEHGGMKRPALSGAHGDKQLTMLREWVEQVSQYQSDDNEDAAVHEAVEERVKFADGNAEVITADHKRPGTTAKPAGPTQEPRPLAVPSNRKPVPKSDAFDPEEFNRKVR